MKRDSKALISALTAVLLWSTVATAFKIALKELSPLDMLLLSCIWSALALGAVLRFKEPSGFRISGRQFRFFLLGALLNPVTYYLILFKSYDLLPAQVAQPLNYTWPLMLVLLSIPFLGKKPRIMDIVSLFICFGGVLLVSSGGRSAGSDGGYSKTGMALALFSAVFWAAFWLSAQKREEQEETRLFWNFALAVPLLLVLKLFLSPGLPSISPGALLSTAWIGLFEMGITFLFWGRALKLSSHPARIGSLVYISPFLSLLWISIILQEKIVSATIIGLAVIVGGILVKGIRVSNRKKSCEKELE